MSASHLSDADMTRPLPRLRARAAARRCRIVLSEGEDPRIITAAITAAADDLADIVLVGDADVVSQGLAAAGGAAGDGIEIADPKTHADRQKYVDLLVELRAHKGMTHEKADAQVSDPLVFSALMVRAGDAAGTVGGAVYTTSDTVRAALQIIGKAKDAPLVSSFFLMALPEGHPSERDAMIFSDSGLVIDPSAEELSGIARQSAASCAALLDVEPRVAMLSFSTMGSARHAAVSKVTEALAHAKEAAPDLSIDGELQFDAAFVPEVGASKAPGSEVAGQANVFIFPNLDAGNIGYKIAQRVGGCEAIGPILQGLAHPANDLSRGCVAEDVVNMIAVTSVQAQAARA